MSKTSILTKPIGELLQENLKKNVGKPIEDTEVTGLPDDMSDAEIAQYISKQGKTTVTSDDRTVGYINSKNLSE